MTNLQLYKIWLAKQEMRGQILNDKMDQSVWSSDDESDESWEEEDFN